VEASISRLILIVILSESQRCHKAKSKMYYDDSPFIKSTWNTSNWIFRVYFSNSAISISRRCWVYKRRLANGQRLAVCLRHRATIRATRLEQEGSGASRSVRRRYFTRLKRNADWSMRFATRKHAEASLFEGTCGYIVTRSTRSLEVETK